MAMKKGGFKSPNGMKKPQLRAGAPGAGKSKPLVGGSLGMQGLKDMGMPGMKKGGMVSKGKKC